MMIDIPTRTSSKKLVQSKISAYFKGLKEVPQDALEKIPKRRTRRKTGIMHNPKTSRMHESNVSFEVSSVSSSGTKRKLKAQIFSEDEDSDFEESYSASNSSLRNKENSPTTPTKKPITFISLNKPSPLKKSPEKLDWRVRYTSTPVILNNSDILSTNNLIGTNVQFLQNKKIDADLSKRKSKVNKSRAENYSSSDSDQSDVNLTHIFRGKPPFISSYNNNSENKITDPCCSKTLANNLSSIAASAKNSERLNQNSNIKNLETTLEKTDPCCSKTVTDNNKNQTRKKNKKSQSYSNKPDENLNVPKNSKIQILNSVVISPAKNTPKNNNSQPKPVPMKDVAVSPPTNIPKKNKSFPKPVPIKDEDKKLNFYYLDVMKDFFTNVMNAVNLKCLLNDDYRKILETFFGMDRNYQYTCVKLFMWKPIWYNIFKYTEKIGLKMNNVEIVAMYNCLKDNGFVDTNYMGEDLFMLLNLLSLKDLREIQRCFKITHIDNTRAAIIGRLITNCKTQITLTQVKSTEQVLRDRIQKKLGFCFKLSNQLALALSHIYLLNTFTNSTLTKPQEYFRIISETVFPSYKTENYYIFHTPEEFSRYAAATELRIALEEAIEKKNNSEIYKICDYAYKILKEFDDDGISLDAYRDPHLEKFTARSQYISVLSTGLKKQPSSAYEEVRIWLEYLLKQKCCNFKRGSWIYHLIMIYTVNVKDYETAAKILIRALEEDKEFFSEIQIHEISFRGKLLDKKTYNLPALYHDQIAALSPPSCERDWPQIVIESKAIRSNEAGRKRKYVQECENGDVNYLTVEQTALEHYRTSGYPEGEHCEGSLVCASFCLLFWDIIYEYYVRGTFVSKVQNAPLDMYTKYFYLNRENLIKTRLYNICSGWEETELKRFLFQQWNEHSHETSLCPIDNVVTDPERLFCVILCIGRSILSRIFERLVKNFKSYCSGMPDLIIWNVNLKKAKFVEVKGENDTLSVKQKLWLNYLLDIGADVEVCHVHSTGSKKKFLKPQKTK